MLAEFIISNRDELLARARALVSKRHAPRPSPLEVENGVPCFLDQLISQLHLLSEGFVDPKNQGKSAAISKQIGLSACSYGHNLQQLGLSVSQVVHGYGDVCQAITSLAEIKQISVSATEYHFLNFYLDEAMAAAVNAFIEAREHEAVAEGTERMGHIAHELRNKLSGAMLGFDALRRGQVGPSGSTGAIVQRSLLGLRDLINSMLTSVRLESGIKSLEPIALPSFFEEIEAVAVLEAAGKDLLFSVKDVEAGLDVRGDRSLLSSAVLNLLTNAFKFTPRLGRVALRAYAQDNQVSIEIEDQCGGLPAGKAEQMFQPFVQLGVDRTGLGLGLAITERAVKAMGGTIAVRNLPGHGCIFVLTLARATIPGRQASKAK